MASFDVGDLLMRITPARGFESVSPAEATMTRRSITPSRGFESRHNLLSTVEGPCITPHGSLNPQGPRWGLGLASVYPLTGGLNLGSVTITKG